MGENVSRRDLRIDTATGVLIIFVVFGHVLETMAGAAAHAAVLWVYLFHMPAFVFLSGYVTRFASQWSPLGIVKRLLFPFIVFAVIQRLIDAWISGNPVKLNIDTVPYTLWYLLALTVWRLAVPVISRLSFWVAVPAAALLAIGAAGIPWLGQSFALARIVGFFPFFVAGLLWRSEWWEWALARVTRLVAAVILAVSVIVVVLVHRDVKRGIFTISKSYVEWGIPRGDWMLQRSIGLLVGALIAFCVIVLVMRVIPLIASIGVASLTVYLLHAIVIYPWHEHGAPDWFAGAWAVLVAAVASFGLAWLLSRPLVVAATRPLMDWRFWEKRLARSGS